MAGGGPGEWPSFGIQPLAPFLPHVQPMRTALRQPLKSNPLRSNQLNMKNMRPLWITIFAIISSGLLMLAAMAQTAPTLTIIPSGTNQLSVTITNNIGTADYDLQWTPALGNPNFPWTFAAIGVPGGTNFLLVADAYPATFFRAVLDTNAVPLWEAADPSNPSSAILKVTILGPANGANLQ